MQRLWDRRGRGCSRTGKDNSRLANMPRACQYGELDAQASRCRMPARILAVGCSWGHVALLWSLWSIAEVCGSRHSWVSSVTMERAAEVCSRKGGL
jgi:hypothetical protein